MIAPWPHGCGALHVAKVWRKRESAAFFEPAFEMWDVGLRCHLEKDHEGPHETKLPAVAGPDAGKLFLWPR